MGKQTEINKRANREIEQLWLDRGIEYCEVCEVLHELGKLEKPCLQSTTNAHRHKRIWYYAQPEKLWDYKQVVRACMNAHMLMEKDAELTEQVFSLLRGKE